MKFKIIKQTSSVYKDFWISLEIDKWIWKDWEEYSYKQYKEWVKSWVFIDVYDVDECRECWILSEEHANALIKYTLWKK